jgi:hypothetical protein
VVGAPEAPAAVEGAREREPEHPHDYVDHAIPEDSPLRYARGWQYMSRVFQQETRFRGIKSSPSYVFQAPNLPWCPRTTRGLEITLEASVSKHCNGVRERQKASRLLSRPLSQNMPGNDLLSHRAAPAVPSALESLTSVFGMGTGVAPPLSSPGNLYSAAD